jgi:chromosome segregation ATPase
MTTVTEGDLKRIEDLIITRFGDLDRKIETINRTLEIHIARTDERFNAIEQRFDAIEQRFMAVDRRFDDLQKQMDQRFEQVDKRFEQVDKRFEQVDKRFEQVDKRFEQVDRQIEAVNARLNTFLLGFLSIVGILVTGLLGIVGKVVFFPSL